jgi:hypothetical protein
MWIIIYIIGFWLAFIIDLQYVRKRQDVTYGDMLVMALVSLLSWLLLAIIGIYLIYERPFWSKVIIKKKGA